jgi:hypothetical protein
MQSSSIAPLRLQLHFEGARAHGSVGINARTLRNTLIGNFLDWCGEPIPCGTGDAGMPGGPAPFRPSR